MSKAFTRESDDSSEETLVAPPQPRLPAGVKNYITEGGARRLREELERLRSERSELAAQTADEMTKRRMMVIDARVLHVDQSLGTAVIVPAPPPPYEQVRFGATVKVRESSGSETQYRIVGMDEMDLDKNWISFYSPMARALMNQPLGVRVKFRTPAGEQNLQIIEIQYLSEQG
jgi:transcription elongation factor GreB